jgi:hypothetical protein
MSVEGGLTLENLTGNPQMQGVGTYKGSAINRRALPFSYISTSTISATYSFVISPASVTTATAVVEIKGTVNSYFSVPNCNVTFSGAYVRE